MGPTRSILIEGIVLPVEWDTIGNILTVAIATFDEKEYLVRNQDKGLELKTFLREKVEIRGELLDLHEKKMVDVIEYRVIRKTAHQ